MTTFEAPGRGGWKRLADHFPRALTAEYQLLYAETCPPGMAKYMAAYGVLARSLDLGYVHGHLYVTPVPLFGPREMRRPPPSAAVWLMARMHPEFRRRTRSARRALEARPWRAVAEEWFASERAGWCARDQAMQDIDVAVLDDDALAAHLADCRALVVAGYARHFELHGDDLLPVGLLLARCAEWGIDARTAAGALAGASPVSTGAVEPPPWQLVTGYDLDSLAWCELGSPAIASPKVEAIPTDLRPVVPAEHHAELDRLVADARWAVPLRDDNGVLTGAWPMGLLRRGMLEAGRRLALRQPDHAVELTVAEVVAALAGGASGDVARTAADRAEARRIASALDAPLSLGPDFAIPPLSALPRALALMGAAQLATADNMLSPGVVSVGSAPYTGRALVVEDPATAFEEIEPGDVVVTTATSPSWNVVLAHAGALVTTTGGVLSHAAVIARELGIPALIGEVGAARSLRTGMVVTVDPTTVTLSILDAAPNRVP